MQGEAVAPRARKNGLLIRELGDETLVYDLDRHKAYCLNQTSALVWRQCDGRNDVADIASSIQSELETTMDADVVRLALKQLRRANLIEATMETRSPGLSRRELIKRAGIAAAVTLPLVTSIVAPTAVEAATCGAKGAACTTGANCCSGLCLLSVCS